MNKIEIYKYKIKNCIISESAYHVAKRGHWKTNANDITGNTFYICLLYLVGMYRVSKQPGTLLIHNVEKAFAMKNNLIIYFRDFHCKFFFNCSHFFSNPLKAGLKNLN